MSIAAGTLENGIDMVDIFRKVGLDSALRRTSYWQLTALPEQTERPMLRRRSQGRRVRNSLLLPSGMIVAWQRFAKGRKFSALYRYHRPLIFPILTNVPQRREMGARTL
jgi:hypothetical protein